MLYDIYSVSTFTVLVATLERRVFLVQEFPVQLEARVNPVLVLGRPAQLVQQGSTVALVPQD